MLPHMNMNIENVHYFYDGRENGVPLPNPTARHPNSRTMHILYQQLNPKLIFRFGLAWNC